MKDRRLHSLLARQLKKVGANPDAPPTAEAWSKLLELVDDAYVAADDERERLERSVSVSEAEMQQALRNALEERERFHAVFASAALGIVLVRPDGTIEQGNLCFSRITGYGADDLAKMKLADLSDAFASCPIGLTDTSSLFECAMQRKDGAELMLEVAASIVADDAQRLAYYVYVVDDVTERRRMAFELKQAQKLETVGRLASGIAHEINTPIQFVGDSISFIGDAVGDLGKVFVKYGEAQALGFPTSLMREVDAAAAEVDMPFVMAELPGAVSRAQERLQRVATIVRAMKEFAHPDQTEQAPVDLASNLRSTIEISRNEYKYVADVETDLAQLPLVTCHAGELNQVFLNLIVNAAHAIGDVVGTSGARGKITVRAWAEGDDVAVSIEDTGAGIPEEIRAKIFDPFFTTKPVGKGTGQGLAIARNVVEQKHGGRIEVTSEVGKGTTFVVWVPIAGRAAASGAREAA